MELPNNGVSENGMNDNGVPLIANCDKGFSIRNNKDQPASDSYYLSRDAFCRRKTELMLEIRRFCAGEFNKPNESYFVVVYGSYGYGFVKPTSDLDIVFYCKDEHCTPDRRTRVVDFITNLHQTYDMQLDNEIPYEAKLLHPYSFLKRACQAEGIFTKSADGQRRRWCIPRIQKTMEYLMSTELLLRFFIGVFVNQSFFVSGNVQMYNKCKGLASRNLVRAVMSIYGTRKVNACTLTKMFCSSPNGDTGDYYLGFSNREPFRSYLLEFLEQILGVMNLQQTLDVDGMSYFINSDDDLMVEYFSDF